LEERELMSVILVARKTKRWHRRSRSALKTQTPTSDIMWGVPAKYLNSFPVASASVALTVRTQNNHKAIISMTALWLFWVLTKV
jgi:hypothetical protein